MAFCDFAIKYDPDKDTSEDIAKKIIYAIIVKRLKAHKPAICFIAGDSGEGKSYSGIRLQQLILEAQGIDIKDYFNEINVYTPLEYSQKIDKLLFDPSLKKVNVICMHEAREVIKAKLWHSFVTQSVADINAMSRQIKRLCIIIISQFIRDITNDVRYTLNYYMKVRRPKGKRARLYIYVMWKDDRDLEKPKLRKRKLSGYLVYPNGRWQRFVPQYLELSKPDKELIDIFEKNDSEAKTGIIRDKLARLLKEMELDIGKQSKKVSALVEFHLKNIDSLDTIGKRWKGKWIIRKEVKDMYGLNESEVNKFQSLLNEGLKNRGVIEEEDKE